MRFLLNTDAVTSAADGYKTASTKVSSIADACKSFDTHNDDGFDFDGAKAVIVSNISACSERMNNSSLIVKGVVGTHTDLQNSFTYENYINPPEEKTAKDADVQYYSGRTLGGGGYSGYAGSSSGFVGNIVSEQEQEKEKEDQGTGTVNPQGTQVDSKKSLFKALSYAKYDDNKLTDEAKKVLKKKTVDEDGYLKIDGRYVIACSSSLATVGNILRFTGSDGKTIECIVGVNTVKDEYKDKMFLLVDKDKKDIKAVDFSKTITDKDTKVESLGNILTTPDAPTGTGTGEGSSPEKTPAASTGETKSTEKTGTEVNNTTPEGTPTTDNTGTEGNNTTTGNTNSETNAEEVKTDEKTDDSSVGGSRNA